MTFQGKYHDWNAKKIKGIIDQYGHNFIFGKKILDLGAGHADISGVLHRLGGVITAVDARQEHLKIAAKKYPGIKIVQADLDRGWPFFSSPVDMILDLDLICHLQNYEEHLKAVCATTQFLVLETAVCDSDDPYKCIVLPENKGIYDLSANGVSSRPTSAAIERVLTENGMNFRRQDLNRYNSGSYIYDWKPKNDGSTDYNKRRLWFCVKNTNPQQFVPIAPPPVITAVMMPPIGNIPSLQDTKVPINQAHILNPALKPTQEYRAPAKKLKTALCISGHLRTFEENFDSVRVNILEKMDCDVFIHTWDKVGLAHRGLDAKYHNTETYKLVDKIEKLYNPKKLVIEPSKAFLVSNLMQSRLIDRRDIPGTLSMFYKIEQCNNLKKEYEQENNFTYDCVIRFRGDLFVENPLPVDTFTNLNTVFFSNYGHFGGISDQFAYGNSSIMDIYSSLYSNIQKYLEEGAPMHPEKLMKYHIEASKLPYTKVNVRYVIRRANGLVQDNMLLERAWGFAR